MHTEEIRCFGEFPTLGVPNIPLSECRLSPALEKQALRNFPRETLSSCLTLTCK